MQCVYNIYKLFLYSDTNQREIFFNFMDKRQENIRRLTIFKLISIFD